MEQLVLQKMQCFIETWGILEVFPGKGPFGLDLIVYTGVYQRGIKGRINILGSNPIPGNMH